MSNMKTLRAATRFGWTSHRRSALGLALSTLCALSMMAVDSPELRREFIYEAPAPTPECHASTLCETKDAIAAAWFGGTREKAPDVGIWFSRREGAGATGRWTPPVELFNGAGAGPNGTRLPCWNPVLHQHQGDLLTLYYKVGPSPSTWWGMSAASTNGGRTWGSPERLPGKHLGPIKNKAIPVDGDFLLFPSSTEDHGWQVLFERHSPKGGAWQYPDPVPDPANLQGIQPTVLKLAGGPLAALGRTRRSGVIFRTVSRDAGRSWSPLAATDLPNPNSGLDAVTLADGHHVLVYNHTKTGRSPLNVALSTDDASTWAAVHALETGPGEYSYPAVIQASDGLVHLTYTWHRTRVRYVVLDPKKFQPRPIVAGQWPRE